MPNRSSKHRSADLHRLAASLVGEAVGDTPPVKHEKNAAAVDPGRKGGIVSGTAHAAQLTPEQRSEIAKKAATARWKKSEQPY